jgi:hypothetical protein
MQFKKTKPRWHTVLLVVPNVEAMTSKVLRASYLSQYTALDASYNATIYH